MFSAQDWINQLGLAKHPEGGYYKEIYRSGEYIKRDHLPTRFSGDRCFSTSIYFLLKSNDFSVFHRIKQDEIWHFYEGSALCLHIINPDGNYSEVILGRNIFSGQVLQAIIPAGSFFGALPEKSNSYSLAGCTVSPGFEFDDLEIPERDTLLVDFPQHAVIIERLTKGDNKI